MRSNARAGRAHPSAGQRGPVPRHRMGMALSMRSLLAAGTSLPEEVRLKIANYDPQSARSLMNLGLDPCEAAELLDEPCGARDRANHPAR